MLSLRYGTMIRWQFHGIGVLTRVWPLHFKDHDDEDYDDVKKLWYTGNVEVLVNSMEIIILLIIWNIVEWGHGIDYNTDSDGNHYADHDNAYGILLYFQACCAIFLPVDTQVRFFCILLWKLTYEMDEYTVYPIHPA